MDQTEETRKAQATAFKRRNISVTEEEIIQINDCANMIMLGYAIYHEEENTLEITAAGKQEMIKRLADKIASQAGLRPKITPSDHMDKLAQNTGEFFGILGKPTKH